MVDEPSSLPSITMRIVYEDLPDIVEVQTRVVVGDWRGIARAYASPISLRQHARKLQAWCQRPTGEVELEAGADTGIGWTRLRFYAIDLAGHVMCHIQLATSQCTGGRAEEVARLSIEMPTDPGLIERYARQLEAIVETVGEEAVLQGVIR